VSVAPWPVTRRPAIIEIDEWISTTVPPELHDVTPTSEREVTASSGSLAARAAAALPEPHERPDRRARTSPPADPDRRVESTTARRRHRLRKRSAGPFQQSHPFPKSIYENITTACASRARRTWPGSTRSSSAAARPAPVGGGEGTAARERAGHVRRPAAAPLHRRAIAVEPEII